MPGNAERIHIPVLLQEVLHFLQPKSGGVYVDGTLGMAGHSEAILHASSPDGRLIAFDWDDKAIALAEQRLEKFAGRYQIIRRNFAEIPANLKEQKISDVDGLLLDVGLSSLQLDMGGRGFSFLQDEPLDMRMDTRREINAADLLANCSEEELADIFYYYGEEKQARRIAAAIVETRKRERISTSKQLSNVVVKAIPRRFHPKKIHVATKTFQGLRIAVNTELENLSVILEGVAAHLKPGARLCVITFHSLEDRIVKNKFRQHSQLEVVTSKPVVASDEEIRINPRSRSAKLRVAARRV